MDRDCQLNVARGRVRSTGNAQEISVYVVRFVGAELQTLRRLNGLLAGARRTNVPGRSCRVVRSRSAMLLSEAQ